MSANVNEVRKWIDAVTHDLNMSQSRCQMAAALLRQIANDDTVDAEKLRRSMRALADKLAEPLPSESAK